MALWKGAHKGKRGKLKKKKGGGKGTRKGEEEMKLPADETDLFSPLGSRGWKPVGI